MYIRVIDHLFSQKMTKLPLQVLLVCLQFQLGAQNLVAEIEKLKNDSDLTHASWGICVMQCSSGQIIQEYNSNISLTPASTQKIVTTAAGLCILGEHFYYQTGLEYDGTYDSITGIIDGNLFIKGSGDPTLQSVYFKNDKDTVLLINKWSEILKSKGIKKINGMIIADASVFEDEGTESNWVWGDMGNYYGAGASGLSYMDNMYSIFFNSDNKNDSTSIVKIIPEVPDFCIINRVKSGGMDDEAYIYGEPYDNHRYVTGTIPAGKINFEVKGSLPDPSYLLSFQLRKALISDGTDVYGGATTVRELKLKKDYHSGLHSTIFYQPSPTLDNIVYWTNMYSNNLFAEHILKTIALKKHGFGTSADGIKDLIDFWKKKGIEAKGLSLCDGCGLARCNAITTRQLTDMLCVMYKESCFPAFYNSLPVAGKSGTMKGLLKGTIAENNLHAKSGSFNRVRSFAGYVKDKKGDQLAFSIIANNFDCSSNDMRKKMENLMLKIAELE